MNLNQLFEPHLIAYYAITALLIAIQAATLGRAFRNSENLRWTIGYLTLFGAALFLVVAGRLDWLTWTVLFIGLGIAGGIKVLVGDIVKKVEADSKRSRFNQQ